MTARPGGKASAVESAGVKPTALEGPRSALRRIPEWVQVVACYLSLRAVSAVITVLVARGQPASLWTKQSPGYLEFAGIWDGTWYARIARYGYPAALPTDSAGNPVQSEWAFYPAYPFTVRTVMEVTGLDFRLVAPWLSLVAGTAATVLIYRLFRQHAGHGTALAAVAVVAAWPPSPVLQYAYSEAICLLGLAGALHGLSRRSYVQAMPFIALVGLARPIGLPLVATTGWILLMRYRDRRRRPVPAREVVGLLACGAVAVAASAVMPVAAAVAGDRWDAYSAVQDSWRTSRPVRPFVAWPVVFRWAFGDGVGMLLLAALAIAVLALSVSRPARNLGVAMHGWLVMYVLYLAVVVEPLPQVFRLTMMAFPLALLVARLCRSRWSLGLWLAVSLAAQWWWIATLWRFTPPTDFAP